MRTLAELLFWAGRVESIVFVLLLVHILLLWVLRRQPLARWLTAAWLVVFLILSITLLYPIVVGPASAGTDDIIGHLYGGFWATDSDALSNVLAHWETVWLPIYIPWLILWAAGLGFILAALAVASHLASQVSRGST